MGEAVEARAAVFNEPFSFEQADGQTQCGGCRFGVVRAHAFQQIADQDSSVGTSVLYLLNQSQEFRAVTLSHLLHRSSLVDYSFIFVTRSVLGGAS